MYALTAMFVAGALFGALTLTYLLRRAVRNELTGKVPRPRRGR